MTICSGKNHEKTTTTKQILAHVKKSETPMMDVRDLMIDIVKQYQKADKVGVSLGLFDKNASFLDTLSWCSVIGKMDHGKDNLGESSKEHLSQLVNYLDNLTNTFAETIVEPIQQVRDKWMNKVLLWDFSVIFIVMVSSVAGLYGLGFGSAWSTYMNLVTENMMLSIGVVVVAIAFIIGVHFLVRRVVLNSILDNLEIKLPQGMSLSNALKLNTKFYRSIFRPNPVGWNLLQKLRLKSISNKLERLYDKLSGVVSHYSEEPKVPEL